MGPAQSARNEALRRPGERCGFVRCGHVPCVSQAERDNRAGTLTAQVLTFRLRVVLHVTLPLSVASVPRRCGPKLSPLLGNSLLELIKLAERMAFKTLRPLDL